MSKKRKKRRSFVPESEAKNAIKKSFREFNWKLAGKLFLSFAVIFSLYHILLKAAVVINNKFLYDFTVIFYIVATCILFAVFVFMNKGLSNDIPTKEQLTDEWTDEQKTKFIEDLKVSRKKAKKVLIILIPFIMTLLFDIVYLLFLVK